MRKWGPLVAVCLGTFMLLLDVTIVIVALPDITSSLGASLSDLQWVIDIYALALAALLIGAGSAADVVGRRKMYVAGTIVFAGASLACGLAPNTTVLVAMRAVQGIGAAAMFATTLSLLAAVYQGRDRSVALGVWGAVSGGAAALGPIAGGLLTEGIDWRWIFFVNLPVSLAAVWLTLKVVPESRREGAGHRIDWAGTGTFTLFAGLTTYAVIRADAVGWGSGRTIGTLVAAVAALGLFIAVERRTSHPLLDLALFRNASFVGVMAGALALNAAAFGFLPYTSIWLQTLLGLSPVIAGLVLVPLAAISFLTAALGGRFLHGAPYRLVIGTGLLLIGAGAFAQSALDAGSGWPSLTAGLLLAGIGVGLVNPAVAGAALASVPPHRAGMASGAVNTFRQLGYALGVAVFGTIVTSRMESSLRGQVPDPHGAARALAGGGAQGLLGRTPAGGRAAVDHALHVAFASGLSTATVVAGVIGILAGVAVLLLVKTPAARPVAPGAAPAGPPIGPLAVERDSGSMREPAVERR
ncbi:MFS transporter [Streptomyces sp. H10-C2]|uniref:MFS transporter n=1 Tax=unclassified Streptomyces TaxID=2593676 RepID=UPI0024BA6FC2|nr:MULTISPECIES: MFS transporter [unclassified Streptomyces]MDJ0344316.1 MFS transporter [Streptomyces sp. PH10-H1]MDJ0373685.1 MFS transporter [Streptomyces sp. H10-C2]